MSSLKVIFIGPNLPYKFSTDNSSIEIDTRSLTTDQTNIYDTPIPTMICMTGLFIAIIGSVTFFCKNIF